MNDRLVELLKILFEEHLDLYGDSVLLDAYVTDSDEPDMVKLPEEISDIFHELKEIVDDMEIEDE